MDYIVVLIVQMIHIDFVFKTFGVDNWTIYSIANSYQPM